MKSYTTIQQVRTELERLRGCLCAAATTERDHEILAKLADADEALEKSGAVILRSAGQLLLHEVELSD